MERHIPTPPDDGAEMSEIQVSELDGAGRPLPSHPLPGPQAPSTRPRRTRLLSVGGIVALVLLLVTLGIPQVRDALGQRITAGRAPTPTVRAPAPPGPVPVLVPSLPAPSLDAAPTTCPSLPALSSTQVPFFGTAIGQSPVYLSGLTATAQSTHLRVTPTTYTPYGWQINVLWAIVPGYTHPVAIHGQRLDDGLPFRLSVGFFQAPTVDAQLVPLARSDPSEDAHWSNWFGTLFLPGAGCYALQAEWPSGSWSIPFAVGR